MSVKHPYQRLRYGSVRDALIEELGFTFRKAEACLRDGRISSFIPENETQRKWYAKDVQAFIEGVKTGALMV